VDFVVEGLSFHIVGATLQSPVFCPPSPFGYSLQRETKSPKSLSSLGGGGTVGDGGGLQATERSPLQKNNVGEGADSTNLQFIIHYL